MTDTGHGKGDDPETTAFREVKFLCFLADFFEVRSGMLADGTDEIRGKFIPDIFIAADGAAPDSLSVRGFSDGFPLFRLGLDFVLVIGVGGGRNAGQHIHIGDGGDEQDVGTQVDFLLHLCTDPGVGAFRDDEGTIGGAFNLAEGFEFVHSGVFPALEAEALEQGKRGIFADDGGGEFAAVVNHPAGVVGFVHCHGDPVGTGGDLGHGVGDTAVIEIPAAGCDDKETVGNGIHSFLIQNEFLLMNEWLME